MVKNNNLLLLVCAFLMFSVSADASELKRNTAKMQAMDKITGRVSVIEVPVGGETKFGTFSIVVRDCQTRSPEETPEDFAFVDVVDYPLQEKPANIFKGWMLSSNPAINPVEHPIYDVWLLRCINTEVDEASLLSEEELAQRDAMTLLRDEETPSVVVETLIQPDEIPLEHVKETPEPKTISDVVNKYMLEDVTFAVSEDTGDEEPNIIIPEYQFKIGE